MQQQSNKANHRKASTCVIGIMARRYARHGRRRESNKRCVCHSEYFKNKYSKAKKPQNGMLVDSARVASNTTAIHHPWILRTSSGLPPSVWLSTNCKIPRPSSACDCIPAGFCIFCVFIETRALLSQNTRVLAS